MIVPPRHDPVGEHGYHAGDVPARRGTRWGCLIALVLMTPIVYYVVVYLLGLLGFWGRVSVSCPTLGTAVGAGAEIVSARRAAPVSAARECAVARSQPRKRRQRKQHA
jgi:hypothetical protein